MNSTIQIYNKTTDIKHEKYDHFYERQKSMKVKDTEYWGLGIENECYLILSKMEEVPREFIINNRKRERYSLDYWKNYKEPELLDTLDKLPDNIMVPLYINAHHFQKTNLLGEHEYLYIKGKVPNPKFSGVTIDKHLKNISPTFERLFRKNMAYDGDTIEFMTYNFYKTNVESVIDELVSLKHIFINEINNLKIFNHTVEFPKFNHGFVRYTTNPKNIAISNNGTLHINITLPTKIDSLGRIVNMKEFKSVHANAIRAIQWLEPLIIGLYGSPDIFSILNPAYNGGSQRLGLSRYIGLGTYDTNNMIPGKLLDTFDYKESSIYFNELHRDSPYNPPEKIGYDINFNKFKKHGIELRFLDSFPEEHLEPVMNLIILACEHSLQDNIPDARKSPGWNELVISCIKMGSNAMVKPAIYAEYYNVFGKRSRAWFSNSFNKPILQLLSKLSIDLYNKYHEYPTCVKMSPEMKPIHLISYNSVVKYNNELTLKKRKENSLN